MSNTVGVKSEPRRDGACRAVGLIGYPLEQTLSPLIHNHALGRMGLNWVYLPLRVAPGRLDDAVRGLRALGFPGANVTIPYKLAVLELCDRLEGDAAIVQSVNTLVVDDVTGEIAGHSTDGIGFLRSLERLGDIPAGDLFLIGAGGAARAVAVALAQAGLAQRVFIWNRSSGRAESLALLLRKAMPSTDTHIVEFDAAGAAVMAGASLVVNTTPLAVQEAGELPLDYGLFHPGQVVCLHYLHDRTAFLERAARAGCRVLGGRGMLAHQAAESLRLWTGMEPPVEEMLALLDAEEPGKPKENV